MVEEGSTFNMNGTGVFSNNSAVGYLGTGNGGAVYVNNGGTFNFIKGELSQNRARRYGGAININQSSVLSISGECDIESNIAGHGGGFPRNQEHVP